jgi:hypothetical protein
MTGTAELADRVGVSQNTIVRYAQRWGKPAGHGSRLSYTPTDCLVAMAWRQIAERFDGHRPNMRAYQDAAERELRRNPAPALVLREGGAVYTAPSVQWAAVAWSGQAGMTSILDLTGALPADDDGQVPGQLRLFS